jgi:hypothetical protein
MRFSGRWCSIGSHTATLGRAIHCADSIDDGSRVNEMAVQCCRRDASAVLCTREKRKRNDFRGGARQPAEPNLPPPIPIVTPLHKRCATSAKSAREKSLRMGGFPESLNSSVIAVQNDFLFNQPCPRLLKFSHDPTEQSCLGRSLG